MATVYFGEDKEEFLRQIGDLIDACGPGKSLIFTSNMDGTLKSGNKRTPLLRTPMAYGTNCFVEPNAIPPSSRFFGFMVVPNEYVTLPEG